MRGSGKQEFCLSNSYQDVLAHQKLRDEFVEYLIMESDNPALQPAREIIERIHCRDFYHIVDVIDVHKHRKQLNDLSDQQVR